MYVWGPQGMETRMRGPWRQVWPLTIQTQIPFAPFQPSKNYETLKLLWYEFTCLEVLPTYFSPLFSLIAACPSNPHIWGDVSFSSYLYYLWWSVSLQKTMIIKATSSISCSSTDLHQELPQYLPFQVMYNIPKYSTNVSSTVNFAFLLNFLSLPARASSNAWGPSHLRVTRWARAMPRTVLILQITDS